MSQGQDVKIDRDVDSLRDTAAEMARRAEAILDKSLRALWERDAELAREVRTDDLDIDRLDLAIDDAVLRILALDAPVAIDLRMVVAIKSAATDLERIGDLARNIAKAEKEYASQQAALEALRQKRTKGVTPELSKRFLKLLAKADD